MSRHRPYRYRLTGTIEETWQRACAFFQRDDAQAMREGEQRSIELAAMYEGGEYRKKILAEASK